MADIRDRMQQLEQQRQTAQRDIQRQAREAQDRARAERSRLEQERQKLLEESRKRQAQLERQRFAPTTDREEARKEIEETEKQREEIEQKAGEVEKEIKGIQKDIEKAEKAAGQEVEKKAKEIKGELETAAAQIKEFEESHIKLDYIDPETKEPQWVSKETWNELEPEQQNELKELGVEKFNELQQERIKEAEAEIAEYEANTIELDYIDPETNEPQRVDIDLFASLDPEQQAKLKELGVEEYNKWVESQNVQANEEHAKTTWDQFQDLLDAGGITTSINYSDWLDYDPDKRIERYQWIIDSHFQSLSTGEIVPNKVWKSLEPEQQKQLNELGIDGFNKLQEQESWDSFEQLFDILEKKPGITRQQWAQMTPENRQEIYETHLNANFVKLKAGGYYPKTPFNEMPTEEQDRLNKLGVEGYNDYLDKNFYPVQGGYLPKDFIDGIENKEHRDYILKNGLESYQDKYLQKLDNPETGENQWITQDSYNELSPEEKKEINQYGVEGFQKRQEERLDKYFNELPPAAKEWVSKNSREAYLDIVNNAGQDKQGFEALKSVGIIHPYAEYKGVDKEGNFEYTIRRADLKNIEFNNLTGDDFWLIVEAVKEDYPTTQKEAAKYITPFGGTGKIYDNQTLASIDKWLKTLTPSQREAFNKAERKAGNERFISILSFVFPPARALREDVTIKDITGIEWAMGVANVGLMVVAPGLGAAGKIGGTIGKVAQVAGKTVQAAATLTFPAITISEIAKGKYEGKPIDLAIDLAIDAAILGAVFGKPLLKGMKEIGNKIGDFTKTSKAYENLAKAIKSGNVNKIKAAAKELNDAALSGKGRMRGNVISQQANYVMANAEKIAAKAIDLPKAALDDLKHASDSIARMTRSGEAGGTITEFAKKNPDAFKKLPETVQKQAQQMVERGKLTADATKVGMTTDDFARFIEARASNPKLTPLEWRVSQVKLEPTIEKMLADLGKAKPMEGSEIAKLMRKKLGAGDPYPALTKSRARYAKWLETQAHRSANIMRKAIDEAEAPARKAAYDKWLKEYKLKEAGKMPMASGISEAEAAIVGIETASQNAAKLQSLVNEAAARAARASAFKPIATPSASLKNLLNTNMLTVVLAYSAEPVIKAIQQADTKTQTKVYEQVSPQIKQVLQQAVDTGAQTAIEKTEAIAQSEIKAYTDAIGLAEAQTIAEVSSLAKTDALTNEDPAVAAAQLAAVSYAQARALGYPEEQAQELAKEDVKELIEAMAVTSVGAATKVVPKDEVKTIDPAIKVKPVKPAESEDVKELIEAMAVTSVGAATKVVPKDEVKTIDPAIKVKPVKPAESIGKIKIGKLIVKLPDDTEKELTEEELEGAIAWKQGFMYILIFPPYGKKNIAYSKKPFPGVRTVDGAQSAFITATRIGGKVPEKLARKLGFFDLKITTPKGGKPKLKYTRRIGKTEYEGEKTLNAAIKGAK